MKPLWKFLTSLRLTVVLLSLGLLIVFFGTLSQVDIGLWSAQKRWFQSAYVIGHLDLKDWFKLSHSVKLPWIFPGGYLVGWLTVINLVASHIKRFQWGWRKVG